MVGRRRLKGRCLSQLTSGNLLWTEIFLGQEANLSCFF